jgi:hypothetical protein
MIRIRGEKTKNFAAFQDMRRKNKEFNRISG